MIEGTGLAIDGRLLRTDLTIDRGQRVALVGPNGGGKTSLLRALALVEGARGDVVVGGEALRYTSLARRRRLVGFMPASRDLVWPIAVRDLVALGLEQPDPARIAEVLECLELEALAGRLSNGLSTGEKTRVLMARVLAGRPALLLLDEPLSNLDPYWVLRFLDIIDAEAAAGATVLTSLHDLSQLHRFDRGLLINSGIIVKDETPDLLLASPAFEESFRVVPHGAGYAISPTAGRRSSR